MWKQHRTGGTSHFNWSFQRTVSITPLTLTVTTSIIVIALCALAIFAPFSILFLIRCTHFLSVSTLHRYDSSHGLSLPLTCLCMTVAHVLPYDNPFLFLPFFSLSSLSITPPVTHTSIFLVCLPFFLPFRLGSRVFSPSLPEGTQPPTSSRCTFGLLAYTGLCPYRWRVHSMCSRYRTQVQEHYIGRHDTAPEIVRFFMIL